MEQNYLLYDCIRWLGKNVNMSEFISFKTIKVYYPKWHVSQLTDCGFRVKCNM